MYEDSSNDDSLAFGKGVHDHYQGLQYYEIEFRMSLPKYLLVTSMTHKHLLSWRHGVLLRHLSHLKPFPNACNRRARWLPHKHLHIGRMQQDRCLSWMSAFLALFPPRFAPPETYPGQTRETSRLCRLELLAILILINQRSCSQIPVRLFYGIP